jgi:hypothetical protein
MRFLLRKDYADRSYGYAVVHPAGIVDLSAVTFDDDRSHATRFDDHTEAERWQAALNAVGDGMVTIIAVHDRASRRSKKKTPGMAELVLKLSVLTRS